MPDTQFIMNKSCVITDSSWILTTAQAEIYRISQSKIPGGFLALQANCSWFETVPGDESKGDFFNVSYLPTPPLYMTWCLLSLSAALQ